MVQIKVLVYVSWINQKAIEFYKVLGVWEDVENSGVPLYKQVKYVAPLGPLEYGIDAGLQLYNDRNKNLTVGQRLLRGGVMFSESAIIDGFSVIAGLGAGAGTGGWGYPVGSYLFSGLSQNLVENNLNPWLFSYPIFGGQP